MSVFIRRFTSDPGLQTLLEIESVDILDLEPPGSITGVGSGTALCVGEYEDGPFDTTEEVASATDLARRYGEFGYTYNGVVGNNPSARVRKVDGTLTPEYWNGNGAVALNSKRFRRLLLTRVDTSVGEVEFERQAAISATLAGGTDQTFDLEPDQYVTVAYGDSSGPGGAGGQFLAAEAVLTSGAGTYPSGFTGGETLSLAIDEGTPFQIGTAANPVVVTFSAADQSQAQVIARINEAVGYAIAASSGGGVTTFTGRIRGLAGSVNVVAGTASVLTAINISVGVTAGTGNVNNIDAVTVSEVNAVAASPGVFEFDRNPAGALRVHGVAGADLRYLGVVSIKIFAPSEEDAAGLGFDYSTDPVTISSQPDGFAQVSANTGVYPSGFTGGETLTVGVDEEPDVTVVFDAADQTEAQVAARINAALGFQFMLVESGFETFRARANGGQIRFGPTTVVLDVLFGAGAQPFTIQALENANVAIPAGTRVENTAQTETWVTMQTTPVRGTGTNQTTGQAASGPYTVKVRHALDDGSGIASGVDTLTRLPAPIAGTVEYFSVTNAAPVSAALTEGQIDVAYVRAIDATLSADTVACETNLIWSARQSNAVRNALRTNAIVASANGCFGRIAVVRPPLGTTRATAKSAVQPGVNGYRDQRVIYTFPGVQTFVSRIAARGTAGGDGFTASGVINAGADGFLVSVCSQLAPEENPGQLTGYATGALGLESGNPDVQNMGISDYIAFRASGICAPRMESGVLIFQSGVTSVNPTTQPQLRNIARRRMADFIQDSLAIRLRNFGKKLSTPSRRAAIISEIRSFMNSLLSPQNPAAQRIDGFRLDSVSGNTPETLALGIFRVVLDVRTLSSLDTIVVQTTIGELVDVSEAA